MPVFETLATISKVTGAIPAVIEVMRALKPDWFERTKFSPEFTYSANIVGNPIAAGLFSQSGAVASGNLSINEEKEKTGFGIAMDKTATIAAGISALTGIASTGGKLFARRGLVIKGGPGSSRPGNPGHVNRSASEKYGIKMLDNNGDIWSMNGGINDINYSEIINDNSISNASPLKLYALAVKGRTKNQISLNDNFRTAEYFRKASINRRKGEKDNNERKKYVNFLNSFVPESERNKFNFDIYDLNTLKYAARALLMMPSILYTTNIKFSIGDMMFSPTVEMLAGKLYSESGFGSSVENPTSSATGVGQFVKKTWSNMVKLYDRIYKFFRSDDFKKDIVDTDKSIDVIVNEKRRQELYDLRYNDFYNIVLTGHLFAENLKIAYTNTSNSPAVKVPEELLSQYSYLAHGLGGAGAKKFFEKFLDFKSLYDEYNNKINNCINSPNCTENDIKTILEEAVTKFTDDIVFVDSTLSDYIIAENHGLYLVNKKHEGEIGENTKYTVLRFGNNKKSYFIKIPYRKGTKKFASLDGSVVVEGRPRSYLEAFNIIAERMEQGKFIVSTLSNVGLFYNPVEFKTGSGESYPGLVFYFNNVPFKIDSSRGYIVDKENNVSVIIPRFFPLENNSFPTINGISYNVRSEFSLRGGANLTMPRGDYFDILGLDFTPIEIVFTGAKTKRADDTSAGTSGSGTSTRGHVTSEYGYELSEVDIISTTESYPGRVRVPSIAVTEIEFKQRQILEPRSNYITPDEYIRRKEGEVKKDIKGIDSQSKEIDVGRSRKNTKVTSGGAGNTVQPPTGIQQQPQTTPTQQQPQTTPAQPGGHSFQNVGPPYNIPSVPSLQNINQQNNPPIGPGNKKESDDESSYMINEINDMVYATGIGILPEVRSNSIFVEYFGNYNSLS